MDDFAIWDRALTGSQIESLARAPRRSPSRPSPT